VLRVTYKEDPSGEWARLEVGGAVVYEGHSVPEFAWVQALRLTGATVDEPAGHFDDAGEWQDG